MSNARETGDAAGKHLPELEQAIRAAETHWLPAAFETLPDHAKCRELIWAFWSGWHYRAGYMVPLSELGVKLAAFDGESQ